MIIKTANSEIIADVNLITIEYHPTEDLHKVIGTTASCHRVLLSVCSTRDEAIELISEIYHLIPGALSLDPRDLSKEEPDSSVL